MFRTLIDVNALTKDQRQHHDAKKKYFYIDVAFISSPFDNSSIYDQTNITRNKYIFEYNLFIFNLLVVHIMEYILLCSIQVFPY